MTLKKKEIDHNLHVCSHLSAYTSLDINALTFGSCFALFIIFLHSLSIVRYFLASPGNCLLMSSEENMGSK